MRPLESILWIALLVVSAARVEGDAEPMGPAKLRTIQEAYVAETIGSGVIQLIGANFKQDSKVFVGNTACLLSTWSGPDKMRCKVAPGVGKELTVTVQHETEYASVVGLFSYAAPVLEHLIPERSPRYGNRLLQISGSNFGTFDTDPKVKIGLTDCLAVKWVHDARIDCVSPRATDDSMVPVMVCVALQCTSALGLFKYSEPYTGETLDFSDPLQEISSVGLTVDMLADEADRPNDFIETHFADIVKKRISAEDMAARGIIPSDMIAIFLAHSLFMSKLDDYAAETHPTPPPSTPEPAIVPAIFHKIINVFKHAPRKPRVNVSNSRRHMQLVAQDEGSVFSWDRYIPNSPYSDDVTEDRGWVYRLGGLPLPPALISALLALLFLSIIGIVFVRKYLQYRKAKDGYNELETFRDELESGKGGSRDDDFDDDLARRRQRGDSPRGRSLDGGRGGESGRGDSARGRRPESSQARSENEEDFEALFVSQRPGHQNLPLDRGRSSLSSGRASPTRRGANSVESYSAARQSQRYESSKPSAISPRRQSTSRVSTSSGSSRGVQRDDIRSGLASPGRQSISQKSPGRQRISEVSALSSSGRGYQSGTLSTSNAVRQGQRYESSGQVSPGRRASTSSGRGYEESIRTDQISLERYRSGRVSPGRQSISGLSTSSAVRQSQRYENIRSGPVSPGSQSISGISTSSGSGRGFHRDSIRSGRISPGRQSISGESNIQEQIEQRNTGPISPRRSPFTWRNGASSPGRQSPLSFSESEFESQRRGSFSQFSLARQSHRSVSDSGSESMRLSPTAASDRLQRPGSQRLNQFELLDELALIETNRRSEESRRLSSQQLSQLEIKNEGWSVEERGAGVEGRQSLREIPWRKEMPRPQGLSSSVAGRDRFETSEQRLESLRIERQISSQTESRILEESGIRQEGHRSQHETRSSNQYYLSEVDVAEERQRQERRWSQHERLFPVGDLEVGPPPTTEHRDVAPLSARSASASASASPRSARSRDIFV